MVETTLLPREAKIPSEIEDNLSMMRHTPQPFLRHNAYNYELAGKENTSTNLSQSLQIKSDALSKISEG